MSPGAIAAIVLALAALPALPSGAAAQRTLDRIVAIVGSRPILASEIDERVVEFQARGGRLPADSAGRQAMRRGILDQLVEEELLVYHAQRDTSVRVTEQEVLDQVEQTVRNARQQFRTDAELLEQVRATGVGSLEEWRRKLTDDQRRTLLAQRLIEMQQQRGQLRAIPPTDAQMREFWEERRAQQPRRPATASFRQIVNVPRADSAARARAYQLAESLVVELRRDADFAATARRFSADSASRQQGGELGWFRRGVMVKEFEDVAFRIRPGEISPPIESPFGFHVIKVERAQPAEVLARHVLIQPDVSPAQVQLARRLADSVHAVLAAGGSFDSLARRFGDPNEPKLAEGAPITQLPPEIQQVLARDSTIGLKPVITLGAGTPRPKFVILEITARHPEGELGFEDVKLQIRAQLGQQLAIQHYIDQLRKQTFVDIRM